MNLENYDVLPVKAQLDSTERAILDVQIATAKAYPRSIKCCIDNSIEMATMDTETAQSCGYALLKGDKVITGPSVHLAKIIVYYWRNLIIEAKPVQRSDKQIVSRGSCWDLESNVSSAFEVGRSIAGSNGRRYPDDMVTVSENAANAIAYRNAVFSVIPKPVVDKVYKAVQAMITGDLSDEVKLTKKRKALIKEFSDTYTITEEEVINLCGKQTVCQIKSNEIALLIGLTQSLKDGDTTVDLLMKPFRLKEETVDIKKGRMKASSNKSKPKLI